MWLALRQQLRESTWPLAITILSSLTVMIAIGDGGKWFATPELRPIRIDGAPTPKGFHAGDSEAYLLIAEQGYGASGAPLSKNVFFPLLPWLMDLSATITQSSPLVVGVIINVCAYGLLVMLLLAYAKQRGTTREANDALIVFSLLPTTLFFRALYTESLFCLWEVLLLLGIVKHWKLRWLALFCALGALTRPVGFALALVLAYHIWSSSRLNDPTKHPFVPLSRAALALLPTLLGLAIFGWIQSGSSGNPASFVIEQASWSARWHGFPQWLMASLSLEPITCPWRPDTIGYWGYFAPAYGIINYTFWNPLIWFLMIGLIVYGWWRHWLTTEELLLAVLIVAIPYWLQAYRTGFTSQGRYVSVALPCYLVAGKLLSRWPIEARLTAVIPAAILLLVFACQFSAGYFVV